MKQRHLTVPLSNYMESPSKNNHYVWVVPLRLAAFVILFSIIVFWMRYPEFIRFPFVIYALLTLGLTVLISIEKKHKLRNATRTLIFLQFLSEIIIESGIIYSTGNVNSPFSGLFVLTIVSAALSYRLVGTLLMASTISLTYSYIIWLGLVKSGDSMFSLNALTSTLLDNDSIFYSVFLHILIFYLIAFISGYLAEKLQSQQKELVVTSKALKLARLETDDILKNLSSGVLSIDIYGNIIYFNRAAGKVLGYAEKDIKGMPCRLVFQERMPEFADYLMSGIEHREEFPRKEISIINKENKIIPLGLSTSILTDENNYLRGVISIFSDLTEAKLMEAKIRSSDRLAAIGELSASIAHEIRNPLASISGSVEVLKKELEVSGDNARLMNLVIKESHRLSKILSEFLSYSGIDRAAYNKVELCHLISEVIEMLRHHESYSDTTKISMESDKSVVYVVGDEDLFKQLLINLAVNACQALENKSGMVTFGIKEDSINPDKIILEVTDHGAGMTEEIQKNIFKPFYSLKKGGTGLGLAIVHRICNSMKIDIKVISKVNEGTTFQIRIPRFNQALIENKNVSVKTFS